MCRPIVLLQIGDSANIDLVGQLVQAHAYWRLKGLAVDLVIWNEDHAGYRQVLHDQIMGLIAAGLEANVTDRPGGIFVRSADQISEEDRIFFETTEFRDRTAFFDVADATRTVSGDLTEYLGRNGSLRAPAAMTRRRLSGRWGPPWIPALRSR